MKKIAILMLVHKNPAQVNQFISQFDQNLFDIFIHVDKKSQHFDINKQANVFLLDERLRVDIKWAHISMVEAMLQLLKLAYNSKYSHYFYVSGQDFLIKPSKDIYEALLSDHHSFINFFEPKYQKKFKYRGFNLYGNIYFKNTKFSRIIRKLTTSILSIGAVFKKKSHYFGSQWSIISHDFATYILSEDRYAIYLKRFKKTLVPDESFFQTILKEANTRYPYKNHMLYVVWPNRSNNPKLFTMDDREALQETDKWVARKFDLDYDRQVIEHVLERTIK